KILALICITLGVAGVSYKLRYTYRDLEKPKLLSASKVPKLKGLVSTSARLDLIEELYQLRTSKFQSVQKALIYPNAPLLHYLLDLKSVLPNPWVNLYPDRYLNEQLSVVESSDTMLVIKLKTNPRYPAWPTDPRPLSKDRDYGRITRLDQFVQSGALEMVRDTEFYTIYLGKT
ncbi:MAG: hypothetical protein KDD62_12855, partial [Bdellovibrionales bacterium]|nr:hypothetical protein [Bdellovibrionales bacterium]